MAEGLKLSEFDAITFDFYGTIVNWEPEILSFLRQWTQSQRCVVADNTLLEMYDRLRQPIQLQRPAWLYPEVLKRTLDSMALELECRLTQEVRLEFGGIAATHRAFPDTCIRTKTVFPKETGMVMGFRKTRMLCCALGFCFLSLNHSAAQPQSDTVVSAAISPDFLVDLSAVDWIHGSDNCERLLSDSAYQEWQQVQYQAQSFVFRQNKCSHYEGPFVYLFIGQEKALLIDSGATIDGGAKLLELIRRITDLPLVVAHSHGHGDHRLGDDAFKGQQDVSVVGIGGSAVTNYFGFSNWPNEPLAFDLGGRLITLLPIPGHNDDDIAYYDELTNVLVTGDTLYPGRLYVKDWPEYGKSIERLANWVSEKSVSLVLGTHIEMSAVPNVDYPIGTTFQPNEHQLPLSVNDINILRAKMAELESPARTALGSFIIWPN